jgi:Right handed beta helix region
VVRIPDFCTSVVLALLLPLALPRSSHAATRYVSPSGSGPSPACTESSPCEVQQGLDATQAGDILYFKAGTYHYRMSHQDHPFPSGTSWSSPVTIAGAPGETVILTQGIGIYAPGGGEPPAQFILFDNFIITGGGWQAIGPNVHDIRFQRSEVKDIQAGSGVGAGGGAHDIEFAFLHVHHNGVPVGPYGHGFYVCIHRATIHDCDVHDNLGYGIQIYDSGNYGCSDGTRIYNNRIYHNSTASGTSTGAATLNYGNNIQFYNNLVYDTFGGGVAVARSSTNTLVANNTFYGITETDALGLDPTVSGVQVKNNIFLNNLGTVNLRGTVDTVFEANLCSNTSEVGCTHTGNPLFTNAGAGDFTLSSADSAARDRAVALSQFTTDFAGNLRGQGGAWDIGSYEYGGSPAPAPRPRPIPRNLRVITKP